MTKLSEQQKKMIKTIFRLAPEKTEAGLQQAFDTYDELHEDDPEDVDGNDPDPKPDPLKEIEKWAKSREEEAKQWKKQQQ